MNLRLRHTTDILTRREKEILLLMTEGLTYKEIAERLLISVLTVQKHIAHIYAKLVVSNKIEAINKWKQITAYAVFTQGGF